MSVLVVGSIALDDIKTPLEEHQNLLGGSASYGSVAASFYSAVNLVGIVGEDFPREHIELFSQRNVDLAGLQIAPGKTFRWSGEYMWDLNIRETRSVALNVFEHFTPVLIVRMFHLKMDWCRKTCRNRELAILVGLFPEEDFPVGVRDLDRGPFNGISDDVDHASFNGG